MSWRYLIVLLLLIGTITASRLGGTGKPDTLAFPISSIPDQLGDWQKASDSRFTENVEGKLKATEYLSREYRNGNNELGLLISYYSEQNAGESMHSPQNCLPGAGWEAWSYRTADLPVEGRRVKVNLYGVQKGGHREQVLYWYQSKRRIIASEYAGKALLVWDSIAGKSTGGALVRLTTEDSPHAVDDEMRVASQLIPEVGRCLGSTPAGD